MSNQKQVNSTSQTSSSATTSSETNTTNNSVNDSSQSSASSTQTVQNQNQNVPQFSDPFQYIVYTVFNQASLKFLGQDNVPTQFIMVATIYLSPQINQMANSAVKAAKIAMCSLQISLFTNITNIDAASQSLGYIIHTSSGSIINLSLKNVNTQLASQYRQTISSASQNRVILFNVVSGSVCIKVPYISSSLSGDPGTIKQYGKVSLLVGSGSCSIIDSINSLEYVFNYTDNLNQMIYFDHQHGFKVVFNSDPSQPPLIEQTIQPKSTTETPVSSTVSKT